jgi:CheY-like chemotaxis protein
MKNLKPISILLAEDNSVDVRLVNETLNGSKLKVNLYHVRDGVELMDFLNKRDQYMDSITPDLILLDLHMPRKSGQQVLKEINENPALAKLPVIVLTISQLDQDILDSYNSNARLYLKKPIDIEKFIAVVKSIDNFWLTIISDSPQIT